MSQNNNDIWTFLQRFGIIVGIITGIVSATVAVLTFLKIDPFQTQQKTSPEQISEKHRSETPERPTQDSTSTRVWSKVVA